ncbi:MAG: DUF3465 domain-containing protein [Acinetobacter sp.]|nr:DUF3465 domain-containing protein [Acinetobacter sp.]
MKKTNMSIGAVIVLLIAAFFGLDLNTNNKEHTQQPANSVGGGQNSQSNESSSFDQNQQNGLSLIQQAFDRHQSNVQVQSVGRVKAVLADDNEGSRHQKFILGLENGLTVLVAHNIDLAPRIKNIQKGDTVEFYGEYEYTEKGGVIHWTHHDPQNRHVGGWLKHEGEIYQ